MPGKQLPRSQGLGDFDGHLLVAETFTSQLVPLKLAIIPVDSPHVFVVVKDYIWFLDYSFSGCHIHHVIIMKRADELDVSFLRTS
jgi:hypothetical protein